VVEGKEDGREILRSTNLIPPGNVVDVEGFRTTWSVIIAVLSLGIAVAILITAILLQRQDLVTWATGLISAIAGSAISYGFTNRHRP